MPRTPSRRPFANVQRTASLLILSLLLATAWPALAATPAAQPAAKADTTGAATPQALIDRLQKAGQSGDVGEIAACLTPDDRTEMTVGLLVGTGMMVAFSQMGGDMASGMAEGMAEGQAPEDKAKMEKAKQEAAAKGKELEAKYEAVLAKHGLKDKLAGGPGPWAQEGADGMAAARQLLAGVDEVALLRDLFGLLTSLGNGPSPEGGPAAKLAKGVTDLKVNGDHATAKADGETIDMVKIGDRWYFKAPEQKGPPPG